MAIDYGAILAQVNWTPVVSAVLLVFAAMAGLLVAMVGGRLLLNAIGGDDDWDPHEDDWREGYRDTFDEEERSESDYDGKFI